MVAAPPPISGLGGGNVHFPVAPLEKNTLRCAWFTVSYKMYKLCSTAVAHRLEDVLYIQLRLNSSKIL